MLFLAAFVGIIAAIAPPVVSQVEELALGVSSGLQSVQDWLAGPPFDLGQDQIGEYVDRCDQPAAGQRAATSPTTP